MIESAPDRRTQLIDAARELFDQRPYDEVTTTEITRRAGVAYGLLAHYFSNKRGLYLATVQAAADRLREVRDAPLGAGSPVAQLRQALLRHVRYVEANSTTFLALIRGTLGSDPEVATIIEELRWEGAQRILNAIDAPDPPSPPLRCGMRGWVGYLDEMLTDRIEAGGVDPEVVVDLAVAALAATLRTVHTIDSSAGIDPALLGLLDGGSAGA